MIGTLDAKIPSGPLAGKWTNHKDHSRLISPNNRRKFEIIVVGSGLAGGSAAATLGELGYRVKCFCYQDSPRRAHSIAAQGGINAALRGNRMGASRRILKTKTFHPVSEFTEGRRGRPAGEPAADDYDLNLSPVVWADQS